MAADLYPPQCDGVGGTEGGRRFGPFGRLIWGGSTNATPPYAGVPVSQRGAGAGSSSILSTDPRDGVGWDPVDGVEASRRWALSLSFQRTPIVFPPPQRAARASDTTWEAARDVPTIASWVC